LLDTTLAVNFIDVQNDLPLAQKTFERALELDPHFASAHLQRALGIIIEIYNGYANDESELYQAEEELHRAEQALPASDGLLLCTQFFVYLAQGRLDRIPSAKMEEWWRKGGNNGKGPPIVVILRMLKGQTEEPLAILRMRLERNPLENPTRMFLGELLRTQGDTAGAIQALQRVVQQAPAHPTAAWFLTMAYLDDGKPEQARALLEGMRLEFEKNYMWRHAWAILLAAKGKREEALRAMDGYFEVRTVDLGGNVDDGGFLCLAGRSLQGDRMAATRHRPRRRTRLVLPAQPASGAAAK